MVSTTKRKTGSDQLKRGSVLDNIEHVDVVKHRPTNLTLADYKFTHFT